MKSILYCIIASFTIMGCRSLDDKQPINSALKRAGKNRVELEYVLNHYISEGDSIKYKAACFLVENMPRHYSYNEEAYRLTTEALKDAFSTKDHDVVEMENKANEFNWNKKKYDVKTITAEYLIENIDFAFKLWREKPWNKHLSFEDFCEYLLPYRLGNEPLENWRKVYYEKYNPVLDSLYSGTDPIEAANRISLYLAETEKISYIGFSHINPGALFYLENKCGNCEDFRDMSIYLLRSLGIPACGDFYRISPDEGAGMHTWAAIKDTTGNSVAFRHPGLEVSRELNVEYKKGKVYRIYYGNQSNNIDKEQNVFPFFKSTNIKDVTSNYIKENQYKIPVQNVNSDFVYLGVHTGERTTLIDIGRIKDGKACFKNVETGLIYQLFTYNRRRIQPVGYPVILKEDGEYQQFIPEVNTAQSLRLFRKYRLAEWLYSHMNYMVNGVVEVSDEPDFSSQIFRYEIKDSVKDVITKTFHFEGKEFVRYIRFKAPYNRKINLSEVAFYKKGSESQITDINISGSKSADIYKNGYLENISDMDLLTYYMSADTGAIVSFDLKKNVQLSKIEITPRTDDNYIRKGDLYELFYHAGPIGWKSLGKQKAENLYLDYENVPQNALFWLKNHTRGQEEQVFYMKDNKQIFTGRTELSSF